METLTMLSKTLGVQLLCNYVFDIANQIACPEEERINKPPRSIPDGLMTVDQARIRLWLTWTITTIMLYNCCWCMGNFASITLAGSNLRLLYLYLPRVFWVVHA